MCVCLCVCTQDEPLSALDVAKLLAYLTGDVLKSVTTVESLPKEQIRTYPAAFVIYCDVGTDEPDGGTEECRLTNKHWTLAYFESEDFTTFFVHWETHRPITSWTIL